MSTQVERPILMAGPMVRAILDGSKTQTRRVIKPQPELCKSNVPGASDEDWFHWKGENYDDYNPIEAKCPYGKPGDQLWVRETCILLPPDHYLDPTKPRDAIVNGGQLNGVAYRANTDAEGDEIRKEYGYKWRPSIHMPRWASRINLLVKDVRVERLQDISKDDAIAEGVPEEFSAEFEHWDGDPDMCQKIFGKFWDSINAKKHPWSSNPWCWCITFERIES